jgi:hypothetical protein
MRSLAIFTAVLVICGSNAGLAQTAPTVAGRSAAALGTINTGLLGTVAGRRLGAVVACPTSSATAAVPFSGATADPFTGAGPTPFPPGLTLPAAPAFGASALSGGCDPNATTNTILEDLGTNTSVTLPGLATITGSTYSDATAPAAQTQVGADGQSPQILVPAPTIPSTSTCAADGTIPLSVVIDPTALAASSSAMAMPSGVSSPSGC